MRAALISLPEAAEAALPRVAGRSAVQCQLELALALGCEMVLAFGHGASPDAVDLRHRAEAAGVRFLTMNDVRALIGAVGEDDSLLVLQPGLWPEAAEAVAALGGPPGLLVLPAGAGTEAGFERIDLDRAWAGAMVLPAKLLAGLGALAGDIAPAGALLRIALQHRLPEQRLAARLLDTGEWAVLRSAEGAQTIERQWLRRQLGEGRGTDFSARLARFALHRHGGDLAAHRHGLPSILALLAISIAGTLASPWYGHVAAGFGLLVLAAPLGELAIGLARIRSGPFGQSKFWPRLRFVPDAVLAASGVLAIDGLWQRSVFAPLVLIAGLLLLDRYVLPPLALALRDRGVVAAALAVLTVLVHPEAAVMAVAAIVLCANLVPTTPPRG